MVSRVLLIGMLCFAGIVASARAQTRSEHKPNIILILADDFGYGDLGCYGQKLIKTPNLDRMAQEGTRFTQAYASAPVCAPSRASLMTGLHQGHAFIRGNADKSGGRVDLRPSDRSIGQMLKDAGYRTGIIGKWGLGEPGSTGIPNKKGFDYFFGYLNQTHAHNYYPDYLWRNESQVPLGRKSYSADLFEKESLDFIARESKGPFFLYLAITLPHANNELNRQSGNGMEVPLDAPYTNENWTKPNKNFAAMVTRLDGTVGKILSLLKDLQIDDNTLVLFSGDNGPQDKTEGGYDAAFFNSTGGLRGLKRSLYEGGIREPTIARWPGKIAAGATNEMPWVHYDLFPTFAQIAGAKAPKNLDGVSILPTLVGGVARTRPYLYWEFHEGGFVQAVRMGDWKGVRQGSAGKIELYDLRHDNREQVDLSMDRPKIVEQIRGIMRREHVVSAIWGDEDK